MTNATPNSTDYEFSNVDSYGLTSVYSSPHWLLSHDFEQPSKRRKLNFSLDSSWHHAETTKRTTSREDQFSNFGGMAGVMDEPSDDDDGFFNMGFGFVSQRERVERPKISNTAVPRSPTAKLPSPNAFVSEHEDGERSATPNYGVPRSVKVEPSWFVQQHKRVDVIPRVAKADLPLPPACDWSDQVSSSGLYIPDEFVVKQEKQRGHTPSRRPKRAKKTRTKPTKTRVKPNPRVLATPPDPLPIPKGSVPVNELTSLYCGHCKRAFTAKPTVRKKFHHALINHTCSGEPRRQYVIGVKHRKCNFGCDKYAGCIYRFARS